MKYFINKHTLTNLIICLSLIAVTCSFLNCGGNKRKEEITLRNKNRHCIDLVKRNTAVMEGLLFDIEYHRNSNRYSTVTKKCLLIDSMRVKYSSRFIRKDLLNYGDTVMKHYDEAVNKDEGVISDWSILRKDVLHADSSAILDLYYLTLTAEFDLFVSYSMEMYPWGGWDPLLRIFGSKNRHLLNDTVNIILRSEYVSLSDEITFDFKGVICKNAGTGKIITPSIEKIGPHYLFIYRPKEKGNYIVDGKAKAFTYNEWRDDVKIHHEFVVE